MRYPNARDPKERRRALYALRLSIIRIRNTVIGAVVDKEYGFITRKKLKVSWDAF